jgi:hypothetical protein
LFFPEKEHLYHTAIDIARNATGFKKNIAPLRCFVAAGQQKRSNPPMTATILALFHASGNCRPLSQRFGRECSGSKAVNNAGAY